VRHLLGWTSPELSRKIRAGSSSLNDLVAGEFVLFNSYITCGLVPPISSFFLLLLEEFGLQLQHLTPLSVLLEAVFAHFMEMFVGVHLCFTTFRHFYALVGSGRSKREIGAYYFQLRHGMSGSYISAFSSTKWEDWRDTESSPRPTPTTAWSCRRKGPSATAATGRPGRPYRWSSTQCWIGSKLWRGAARCP
jgi:hypothetical protein